MVSINPFAYRVNAKPIMTAAKIDGPRMPFNDLKLNINKGVKTIKGQALKNTTLQDAEIPALSMALSGS